MKERPILFSGPMVRAILDGRKTQTRRVLQQQPEVYSENAACWRDGKVDLWRNAAQYARDCCPFGVPGDRLWVREKFQHTTDARGQCVIVYAADDAAHFLVAKENGEGDLCGFGAKADRSRCHPIERWRPSIYMPRWASRITLEVVSVRVERLQDISEADCAAEGIVRDFNGTPIAGLRHEYAALWDSINGDGAWDRNPWVWVVKFKRSEGGAG